MKEKPGKTPMHIKEQSGGYETTYEEAARHPYIEERFEIIEGIRYEMQPSPTFNHQWLVTQICNSIDRTCSSTGTVLVAPMDVYFDEDNIFQPDVIYIANDNSSIIKRHRIEGAPDLVVEILSPSTSANDKIRKKRNYERFGVPEYWIVDPVHRLIDQFIADNGKYALDGTYSPGGLLQSPRFSCISIDMDKLFSRLLPDE
jgi:Uma2 family endonuclease